LVYSICDSTEEVIIQRTIEGIQRTISIHKNLGEREKEKERQTQQEQIG
jgi:hypothetical protein